MTSGFHGGATIDGANIRVRLLAPVQPFSPDFDLRSWYEVGVARTDDSGYADFCVPTYWELCPQCPRYYAFLLESSDSDTSGTNNPAEWGDRSVTVFDRYFNPGENVYRLYTGPLSVSGLPQYCLGICGPFVFKWMIGGHQAVPYVVTTVYAYDIRQFIASLSGRSVFNGLYPVNVYLAGRVGGAAWADIELSYWGSWDPNLMAHEYGHHGHYAEIDGELWPEPRLTEGWAHFFQHSMGYLGFVFRSGLTFNVGDPESTVSPGPLPDDPANPLEQFYIHAYFHDLWDNAPGEELSPRCQGVNDTMSRPFSEYYDQLQLNPRDIAPPGANFYDQWINSHPGAPDMDAFNAVSFHHWVSDDPGPCPV